MVERLIGVVIFVCTPVLAQAELNPPARLDPVARAKLIGALILLTIGGLALVVLAWLALRMGRRSGARNDAARGRTRTKLETDDWAATPLVKTDNSAPSNDGP